MNNLQSISDFQNKMVKVHNQILEFYPDWDPGSDENTTGLWFSDTGWRTFTPEYPTELGLTMVPRAVAVDLAIHFNNTGFQP